MLDLLERQGTVDTFFAEADPGDVRIRARGFDERHYDAILVWQLHEAFALLSGRHPNVTFAPMYDAMFRGGAFRWRRCYGRAKILCFSWALRAEVMRRTALYHQVQYYPEVGRRSTTPDDGTLRGLLWYRHRAVTPARVFALTARSRLAHLVIHDAPDPGHAIAADSMAPQHIGQVVRTTWSDDRAAFDAGLATANLFFAARPLEGIGMSFLEAMAAGLCVVAPDAPTMNEYISHGRTGLLYALDRMAPLDLSNARAIGARARESVLRGRERWEAGVPRLTEFLLTPGGRLARRCVAAALPAGPSDLGVVQEGAPLPQSAWIVFCPPGQSLIGETALRAELARIPPETEVVTGQHLQAAPDGSEALVRPADPGAAWARLLEGEVGPEGPLGIPIAAATAFRRDLLRRLGARFPAGDAALLDLLLRAKESGAVITEGEEVLARRTPAPPDVAAWSTLLRARAGEAAARRFEAALGAARAAAAARVRAARPAHLGLAAVSALAAFSPRLGDALEGALLGGTMRRLRSLLHGKRAR